MSKKDNLSWEVMEQIRKCFGAGDVTIDDDIDNLRFIMSCDVSCKKELSMCKTCPLVKKYILKYYSILVPYSAPLNVQYRITRYVL